MTHRCKPVLARKIVKKLDPISRVRVDCRNFRNAVDVGNVEIEYLTIKCSEDSIQINWADEFNYGKHPDGCCVKCQENNVKKEKIIEGEDYFTCAMRDLATTLVNPKLSLKRLSLDQHKDDRSDLKPFLERFKTILRSRDNELSVQSLELDMKLEPQDMFDVLSFMKPRTLFDLSFDLQSETTTSLGKIVDLPQWKQAKFLEMRSCSAPIDSFLHFTSFDIEYRNELSLEEVKKLVNAAIQKGEEFGHFYISECNCDYHIAGYLEQISSEYSRQNPAPLIPEPPPMFGPYPDASDYDVTRRRAFRRATSCSERRFIPIQSEWLCLSVTWDNDYFTIDSTG